MENAGVNKDLIPGAAAPEGVMDGTPEITEDNLFELVDSGAITMEKANGWIAAQEQKSDGAAVETEPEAQGATAEGEENPVPENNEPVRGGVVPGENKPFRVYQTQEEFQRDFDRSWDKRYGKQKEEAERKDAEYKSLLSDVAELLGVEPDEAAAELRKRKLTSAAQKEGKNPDEYIETENLRAENKRLKETEDRRKAEGIINEINAQGARIKETDPAFDINEAMKNPDFARQVFFTRQTNPERAVEIAYKIYYEPKAAAPRAAPAPTVVRPREGAATAATTGEKRPVDFSRASDADILKIQERLLRGESIDV